MKAIITGKALEIIKFRPYDGFEGMEKMITRYVESPCRAILVKQIDGRFAVVVEHDPEPMV